MIRRLLARVARMDRAEVAWRLQTAARIGWTHAQAMVTSPHWRRRDLASRITVGVDALAGGRFDAAHEELSKHFAHARQRFAIAHRVRDAVRRQIARELPRSADGTRARADRLLFGDYDLLGYEGLRFDGAGSFEWNYDPVHKRRAPQRFWSAVPYLDPEVGDHKIIWELNRHQHWLTLGRAYWLTGEARYRDRVIAELSSWIDTNPPLVGINWASMLELAFRALSWIWALHIFVEPDACDSTPWTVDLLLALDRQLTHVEHNLSYYFSPNTHLTGEALALYIAGRTLPELTASGRREALGRRILIDEITRQIASDGGHCERSTHYHRYTLDYYTLALIVARITGDPAAAVFEAAVDRLAFAARVLADERGRLPHIGDDDGGSLWIGLTGRRPDDVRDSLAVASALLDRPDLRIGPMPEEAFWLLSHPAFERVLVAHASIRRPAAVIPSTALPQTGYYVSRSDDATHMVIDGGPHGHLNAGHAHADALSLTLEVRGLPLLIDPGAACYTIDPGLRDRMRSTALHNTVTVDDRPQSVPKGPFHWLQTANASVARWRTNDGFDYFDGSHDGYQPLVHRRHVLSLHRDLVIVADLVDAPGVHRAAAHWHLDPRWTVEGTGRRRLVTAGRERVGLYAIGGGIDVVSADPASGLGWYSPAYGRVDATRTIRIAAERAAPLWIVTLFDLDTTDPVVEADRVPIWAEAGTLARGIALRVLRSASIDYLLIAEPSDPHGAAPIWRVADFETDARMLFCRVNHERRVTRLALVDGSIVRGAGRRLQLVLPAIAPDLHLDLSAEARIAGAAFGARLSVGGREFPVTPERRASPRS